MDTLGGGDVDRGVGPGAGHGRSGGAPGRRSTTRRQGRVHDRDLHARGQALWQDHGAEHPNDAQGKPKTCTKCTGADKDKPFIGLVIIKDLGPDGDRYKGGTILDPSDGKVYKGEVWLEDGQLKVRGYLGVFYRTRMWLKAS